jgi:predicted phosphodiesterase
MLLQTPWPPWRGVRQLLHVGPWGGKLDVIRSKLREPKVLYHDLDSGTAAEQMPLSHLRPREPSSVRVVVVSDTHGKHRCVTLPEADVLVHCGDVLQRYGYPGGRGAASGGLDDFDAWLGEQRHIEHRLVVGGNHDVAWEEGAWQPCNARMLCGGEVHRLCGLTFWGSPHSLPGVTSNTAFQAVELGEAHATDAQRAVEALGEVDVLVTHARSPLFEQSARSARVWLHGHLHDEYGVSSLDRSRGATRAVGHVSDRGEGAAAEGGGEGVSCVCVNAATCDMIYRPVQPPVVLDIPRVRPRAGLGRRTLRATSPRASTASMCVRHTRLYTPSLRASTARTGRAALTSTTSAAMSRPPSAPARVLCLHGGGTNAEVMRQQTAKLRARLRGMVEFEFFEGTTEAQVVDPAVERRFGKSRPFYSW